MTTWRNRSWTLRTGGSFTHSSLSVSLMRKSLANAQVNTHPFINTHSRISGMMLMIGSGLVVGVVVTVIQLPHGWWMLWSTLQSHEWLGHDAWLRSCSQHSWMDWYVHDHTHHSRNSSCDHSHIEDYWDVMSVGHPSFMFLSLTNSCHVETLMMER